jgi:hypothetical protein
MNPTKHLSKTQVEIMRYFSPIIKQIIRLKINEIGQNSIPQSLLHRKFIRALIGSIIENDPQFTLLSPSNRKYTSLQSMWRKRSYVDKNRILNSSPYGNKTKKIKFIQILLYRLTLKTIFRIALTVFNLI